jgi:hypothetical protein
MEPSTEIKFEYLMMLHAPFDVPQSAKRDLAEDRPSDVSCI